MFKVKNLLSGQDIEVNRRSSENPHCLLVGENGSGKTKVILDEISKSLDENPGDVAVVLSSRDQLGSYAAFAEAHPYGERLVIMPMEDANGNSSEENLQKILKQVSSIVVRQFRQKKCKTWLYIDSLEVFCRHEQAFKDFYSILRVLRSRYGVFAGTLTSFERVIQIKMIIHTMNVCGVVYLFRTDDSPMMLSMLYELPESVSRKIRTLKAGNAVLIHDAIYDFVCVNALDN